MRNLIGTTIQHYQVLLKIRETATRVLFKVYNTQSHNFAALEVVKQSRILPGAELLHRLNEQAQKFAGLKHPNIATVIDSGIHEELIYLVYNFIPTQPYRRLFNRIFPWQESAHELAVIADALAQAHEKDVVHGHLCPASIVLDNKRNPRLFDFGFEQIISTEVQTRMPGVWINRWGYEYLAPEQFSGTAPDARSDIYSLGMIMQEWLTGKVVRLGTPILKTLLIRLTENISPAKEDKLPAHQRLVQKCTALDPADRYQSMQEIFLLMVYGAMNMPVSDQAVIKPLASPGRPKFHRLWLMLMLILVVAVGSWQARTFLAPHSTPVGDINSTLISPPLLEQVASLIPQIVSETKVPVSKFTAIATTPAMNSAFILPFYQGTPVVDLASQAITYDTVARLSTIGRWGMGALTQVATSPADNRIVAASTEGIYIFDGDTLTLEKYIDTGAAVSAIEFSPDGDILATGSQDGLIQLWETNGWKELMSPLSGHAQLAILDLAFSPDSTRLASVSMDNAVIIWEIQPRTGKRLAAQVILGATSVAFADHDRVLIGGDNFKIEMWDANQLSLLDSATFSGKLVEMEAVVGTAYFVLGSNDQSVNLLDITNGLQLSAVGRLNYPLTSVTTTAGGDRIAAGDSQGGITLWDRTDGTSWSLPGDPPIADTPSLPFVRGQHLSFGRDGRILYSGLWSGRLRSLDAMNGTVIKQSMDFSAFVVELAISHNSKYALTQQTDNQLTLWDIQHSTPVYHLEGDMINGDPFSPDDRWFAVAIDESTVRVFETANGQTVYTFHHHQDIQTIQFIANGAQLAVGNDKIMHLWSMTSGQELIVKRIFSVQGCVTIKSFSNLLLFSITNYQQIVTDSQDNPGLCNFQKLGWSVDINEGKGVLAFGGNSKLAVMNTGIQDDKPRDLPGTNLKNFTSLAINPGGDILAAASFDTINKIFLIELWNIATGQKIEPLLQGHQDEITDLQFSLDGKYLLSTSLDGTIRVWGIPMDRSQP